MGAALRLSSGSQVQLNRAKSVVNQNKSDLLIGEMFEVVFHELTRYLNILQIQKSVDWTIYAQKRSGFSDMLEQSVDSFELLDRLQDLKLLTPTSSLEKTQSDTQLEKTASEIAAE